MGLFDTLKKKALDSRVVTQSTGKEGTTTYRETSPTLGNRLKNKPTRPGYIRAANMVVPDISTTHHEEGLRRLNYFDGSKYKVMTEGLPEYGPIPSAVDDVQFAGDRYYEGWDTDNKDGTSILYQNPMLSSAERRYKTPGTKYGRGENKYGGVGYKPQQWSKPSIFKWNEDTEYHPGHGFHMLDFPYDYVGARDRYPQQAREQDEKRKKPRQYPESWSFNAHTQ